MTLEILIQNIKLLSKNLPLAWAWLRTNIKKTTFWVLVSIMLILLATNPFPAPPKPLVPLIAAGGGANGLYTQILADIAKFCPGQITVNTSSGSEENIKNLSKRESGLDLAIVQLDTLQAMASTTTDDSYSKSLRVLFKLHPEYIQFVVKNYGPYKAIKTVEDLEGKTILVTGGARITAQRIKDVLQINFKIEEANGAAKSEDILQERFVMDKTISGALFVAGDGFQAVQKLLEQGSIFRKPNKIIGFKPESLSKFAQKENVNIVFYKPVQMSSALNYHYLSEPFSQEDKTIATNAVLLTYNYKNDKTVKQLSALKKCINEQLTTMAEGKESKVPSVWIKILGNDNDNVLDNKNTGGWPMFMFETDNKQPPTNMSFFEKLRAWHAYFQQN